MIPRSLPGVRCILEVERKFCSLAVNDLTRNNGYPPFHAIKSLGQQVIHDAYYDQSSLLSSAGVWVRQRNGQWEAKIKKGGNFVNSSFEELYDLRDISRCIRKITGVDGMEQNQFGLERIATMSTVRKAWIADREFQIVLDTADFGHTVGEVELEQTKTFTATAGFLRLCRPKARKVNGGRTPAFHG